MNDYCSTTLAQLQKTYQLLSLQEYISTKLSFSDNQSYKLMIFNTSKHQIKNTGAKREMLSKFLKRRLLVYELP